MKIRKILLAVTLGVTLAAVESTSVEAMDTDVYLHTQSTTTVGAPDVLIILDNSGSMTETVPTAPPYDPSIDYCSSSLDSDTGVSGATAAEPANCSTFANRIYYTSGRSGTPQLTSSNTQWFAASKTNCIAAQSALSNPGYYSGDYIAYWGTSTNKWAMLLNGGGVGDGNIQYVDCNNDNVISSRHQTGNATADGEALNDGLSPAGSGTTPYISSGTLFSYSTRNTLSLYTSNYLAYANNSVLGGAQAQPKIDIAKQAVINLINSNKTVRFGLMIFNVDTDSSTGSTSSGTVQCLYGDGCSGGRLVFSVDDMSDTRRTDMTNVVNGINAETWTPLSETLYEAYNYYAGNPLVFGNDQYTENPTRDLTGETYTTQTAAITYGTTTTDSNGNTVWVVPSSETYTSPINFSCQKPNIIIVTDGDPTNDTTANSAITKLLTGASQSSCSNLGGVSSDCLDDLAGWMHTHDVNSNMPGSKVTTYTIGFGQGISSSGLALLQSTAQKGGGLYTPATDAGALNTALQAYLANIQQQTASFSAPSLAINAFNKQFDNDYIYLSLFLPAGSAYWDGNVKKYRLCTNADITAGYCTSLSDVLDSQSPPEKVTDSSGNFVTNPTPQSFWSPSPDGSTVTLGGAGANVPATSARALYTYYDSSGVYSSLTAPSSGVQVSTSSSNTFYQAVSADPTLLGLPAGATSTQVQTLVNWILGQDSYNTNTSLQTQQRWTVGDPLHSTVTPITLGCVTSTMVNGKCVSGSTPIIKLLIGDNDGVIRMINENSGVEEWSFLPQEMYAMQYALSQNPAGTHLYGVDATPTVWVQDVNNDGVIDPAAGDHVYMFIGMRRGGRDIYAFDVTPDHVLTSQSDHSNTPPKLMWVIQGGTGNFAQLGQTWSQPLRVRVRYKCPTSGTNVCDDHNPSTDDSSSRPVLMFAGGYDPHQDTAIPAGPDSMGNAIYMVDPFTGSLIWWASSNTNATLVLPQMLYSIPSDLRLVDTDGDGSMDRLYVGDTGGQLWRIDLGTQLAAGVNGGTQGYVFADVGCGSGVLHLANGNCPSTTAVQDIRKFFYPPDRAPVNDTLYSASANYDLVTIGSGDREDPLDLLTATRVTPANSSGNEPVHNRLYAFRDYNYATGAPSTVPAPLTEADLYDATANQLGTDTGSTLTADINTLSGDKGLYIDLKSLTAQTLPNGLTTTWIGEKDLASTEIVEGVLYATTYTPANNATSAGACQVTPGTATVYALNALNLTVASGFSTSSGERAGGTIVGSGIPSQVVLVFRQDGTTALVDAGNGGGIPVGVLPPQVPTNKRGYWFEE